MRTTQVRFRLSGNDSGIAVSYVVQPGANSLGTHPGNDLVLREQSVSRQHAVLTVDPTSGATEVRDTASTNGTFVNGRLVTSSAVHPGDRLTFGGVTLCLEEAAARDTELAVSLGMPPDGDAPKVSCQSQSTEVTGADCFAHGIGSWQRPLEQLIAELTQPRPVLGHALHSFLEGLGTHGGCIATWLEGPDPVVHASWGQWTGLTDHPGVTRRLAQLRHGSDAHKPSVQYLQGEPPIISVLGATADGELHGLLICGVVPGEREVVPLLRAVFRLFRHSLSHDASRPPINLRPQRSGLVFPDDYIVCRSPAMSVVYEQIAAAVASRLPVLLVGETGVGKEPLARTVHLSSDRRVSSFVTINCAAIPSELLEAELFGIGAGVATALAAAHQVNLIHRDIKPSNIMVERRQDGTWHPYLLDFGLSRNLSIRGDNVRPTQQSRPLRADSTVPLELTEVGHVVGTPAFMAPEQAKGDAAAIGEPSDVFSLGATMYAVLGGHPPFTGTTQREILERVVASEPIPLKDHSKEIPRDLAAIVMRCLDKNPNQRYPAAVAVADDLRAFLQGYPVSAVRPTLRYVAAKAVARRPFVTAVLVLVLAAASAFGSLWIHARWSATQEALVAAKMGHRVAETKSYLWKARSVPLHDIRPHIAEARKQMASVRTAMASAGGTVRGAGHQALGEAHLELDELEEASHHLHAAWQSGYRTTEGAFAMARTVGGLYRRDLAEVEHIREARLRELRLEEIRSKFGHELMTWWRRIEDSTGSSHQLLEAMVASHEGQIDEALHSCAMLIDIAPWIYEAHLISGDLHLLQAAKEQPMSDPWLSSINRARSSFGAAAQLAPSDLRCHLGRARTELFVFERCETPGHEEGFLETVEAESALGEAQRIDPSHPELLRSAARLQQHMARSAASQRRSQLLQDGLAQLNPLIERNAPDARALLLAARLLLAQGGDSQRTHAWALLQRAIAINPFLATEASALQGQYGHPTPVS